MISTKELTDTERAAIKNVPYPLQPVILTDDHLGTQMKSISLQLSELQAHAEEEAVLRTFASLPSTARNAILQIEKSFFTNLT